MDWFKGKSTGNHRFLTLHLTFSCKLRSGCGARASSANAATGPAGSAGGRAGLAGQRAPGLAADVATTGTGASFTTFQSQK